jgi:hypothetical protein
MELDSEHEGPVCPLATFMIAGYLGRVGGRGSGLQVVCLYPGDCQATAPALPQLQGDPLGNSLFNPPIFLQMMTCRMTVQLAGICPIPRTILVARTPLP